MQAGGAVLSGRGLTVSPRLPVPDDGGAGLALKAPSAKRKRLSPKHARAVPGLSQAPQNGRPTGEPWLEATEFFKPI